MNRLGAGFFCDIENDIAFQIRIHRARAADQISLVGKPHVLRMRVGFRVNSDGANADAFAGLDDAASDFAAIGDKNLAEHMVALSHENELVAQHQPDTKQKYDARKERIKAPHDHVSRALQIAVTVARHDVSPRQHQVRHAY